jgi:hypothetical protein
MDPPTGKPFQGHLGLVCSRRTHVDTPRLCPGVRSLSVGDGNDHDFGTKVVRQLHEPSAPEHLVVRVRCDNDKSTGRRDLQRLQAGKTRGFEPGRFVGPTVEVVDD